MNFESLYELRVGLVVQARKDIASLENQVPFFYRNADGRPATHFFDYRATQRSGKRIAIMVKAAERAASPRVDDELRVIARQVPSSFADRVVVMTEEDLDPIEVYNAELLHEMRMPEPEVDAAARRAVCSMVGPCELGRLIEMIGHAGLISPT
ncbi:hypothetical protein [Phycobacter azelaicus]|uniref:hypothetical protein n=1 Tax=Phycobacter azelaicus TaxID=2668075 RepID=UPI001867BF76|nr:hypothetical protein [Phycobacter azelaicus]